MKNLRYLMDYDPNTRNVADYRNFIQKNIDSLNNKDRCDPKEKIINLLKLFTVQWGKY